MSEHIVRTLGRQVKQGTSDHKCVIHRAEAGNPGWYNSDWADGRGFGGKMTRRMDSRKATGVCAMRLMLIGLCHRTAPVEVRERFAISDEGRMAAFDRLRCAPGVREAVILSTCNRTEVYAVVDGAAESAVLDLLEEVSGLTAAAFGDTLYTLYGMAVVRHLLRLVAGLDSLVLGETQILGQVKSAVAAAQDCGMTGVVTNTVFRDAISFGKRVHTQTGIGQNAVSVSQAAVRLARTLFGDLSGLHATIVGAGKMAELALRHLREAGVLDIAVLNRTAARAMALADRYAGEHGDISELESRLATTDIVISSTGARGYMISGARAEGAIRRREGRPLLCLDIAVPRDIDPAVAALPGVHLCDIDDLSAVASSGMAQREREAQRVLAMVDEELERFATRVDELRVAPAIVAMRSQANDIRARILASLYHKEQTFTTRQRELIERHLDSALNQVLRAPTAALRQAGSEGLATDALDWATRLFDLGALPGDDGQVRLADVFDNVDYAELATVDISARRDFGAERPVPGQSVSMREMISSVG